MSIVVSDTGVLISLIHINKLFLIEEIFGKFFIAEAVWNELNNYDNPEFDKSKLATLKSKIRKISSKNYLSLVMDLGESESVILYDELNADFLLIDDNKARIVAELLSVKCIGTLGLLIKAKRKGLIAKLRPIFFDFSKYGRYFSTELVNQILEMEGEERLG